MNFKLTTFFPGKMTLTPFPYDLRLQFEALSQFTPEEKAVARIVLESLILKHDASRYSRAAAKTPAERTRTSPNACRRRPSGGPGILPSTCCRAGPNSIPSRSAA